MNTCVYVLLARYLWPQCQCEPRAIELVRIAEAMPDFAACFLQDAKVLQDFGSCKKNRLPWNPIYLSHRNRVLTSHRNHRTDRAANAIKYAWMAESQWRKAKPKHRNGLRPAMRHDYPHAETQRAQRSRRDCFYVPQIMNYCPAEIAEIAERGYAPCHAVWLSIDIRISERIKFLRFLRFLRD